MLFLACLLLSLFGVAFAAAPAKTGEDQEIHQAARKNDVEWLKNIIENGADIDAIGAGGQTPLVAAALAGHAKAVKYLLDEGADCGIGEKDGYTAQHAAAFQGRAKVIEVLAEHGMDLDDFHNDGYAPIHRAAWGKHKRHTEAIQALFDAGANILLQSKDPPQRQAGEMAGIPESKMLLEALTRRYIKEHQEALYKNGMNQKTHGHMQSGHHAHDKHHHHRKLHDEHEKNTQAILEKKSARRAMKKKIHDLYMTGQVHESEQLREEYNAKYGHHEL